MRLGELTIDHNMRNITAMLQNELELRSVHMVDVAENIESDTTNL